MDREDKDDLNSINNNNIENIVDINNYDIDELIERPRISSVPKNINTMEKREHYRIYNKKKENKDSNNKKSINKIIGPDEFDVYVYIQKSNIDAPKYDFDVSNYGMMLQNYLKEKNRLLHDDNYRKFIMLRNKIILEEKSNEEKISILRDIDKYFTRRGPEVDSSIQVKICDIGNACWFNHHFSTIIQTRQYRSPEVILGIYYNETSDIWSLACIIFELVTGDFLFNPTSSEEFCKNDSHLCKFMEICGKMPKNFVERGIFSKKYFDKNGKLKRVGDVRHLSLKNILVKKYHIKENEAQALVSFLMPMLEYYPEKRISARELLKHPWLNIPTNDDGRLNDFEVLKMNMDDGYLFDEEDELSYYKNELNWDFKKDVFISDSDLNEADSEDNDKYDNKTDFFLDKNDKKGDQNPDKIIRNKIKTHKRKKENPKNKRKFNLKNIVDKPNTQFNCINKNKNNNKKSILCYI